MKKLKSEVMESHQIKRKRRKNIFPNSERDFHGKKPNLKTASMATWWWILIKRCKMKKSPVESEKESPHYNGITVTTQMNVHSPRNVVHLRNTGPLGISENHLNQTSIFQGNFVSFAELNCGQPLDIRGSNKSPPNIGHQLTFR